MPSESYNLVFVRQSEKAAQFSDGDKDFWLPKSQIEVDDFDTLTPGESIDLYIPDWLAEDKGLM